jgi:hypothetical protein
MPALRRSLFALFALGLATFALAGCVRFDMALTIRSDDTVDGTVLLALRQTDSLNGLTNASIDKAVSDGLRDLPAGARTEPYDQDGFRGMKVIYDRVPFAEFDRVGGDGDPGGIGRLRVRHENGRITFTMNLDLADPGTVNGRPLVESMLRDWSVRVSVTFPGRVIEQDHGVTDGDTVRWDVRYGDTKQLRAVAEDGVTARWPYLVGGGCCLAGVALAAGLAVWLVRRRRLATPAGSGYHDPTLAQPAPWHEDPGHRP